MRTQTLGRTTLSRHGHSLLALVLTLPATIATALAQDVPHNYLLGITSKGRLFQVANVRTEQPIKVASIPGVAGASSLLFDTEGRLLAVASTSDGKNVLVRLMDMLAPGASFPTTGSFASSKGAILAPHGNVIVTTNSSCGAMASDPSLLEISPTGSQLRCTSLTQLQNPTALAMGPQGHVFVTGTMSSGGKFVGVVSEFTREGVLVRAIEGSPTAPLANPVAIAFGPNGSPLVADHDQKTILRFNSTPDGGFLSSVVHVIGVAPSAMTLGPNGNVFVAIEDDSATTENEAAIVEVNSTTSIEEHRLTFEPVLDDGETVRSLVFAPTQLRVELKGTVVRDSQPGVKFKEKNVALSVSPGSRTVAIKLPTDPTDPKDIASLIGTSNLVFHGFEVQRDSSAGKRVFEGLEFRGTPGFDLVSMLTVTLIGPVGSNNSNFSPTSGTGALQVVGGTLALTATIRVISSLN